MTFTNTPILRGHHTIGNDTVPFTVHENPAAATPDKAFIGIARYQGRTIIAFANNAPDCGLGLLYLLHDAAKRPPVKERLPLDTSIPGMHTIH